MSKILFMILASISVTPASGTANLFHMGGDNNDDNSDTFQQSM